MDLHLERIHCVNWRCVRAMSAYELAVADRMTIRSMQSVGNVAFAHAVACNQSSIVAALSDRGAGTRRRDGARTVAGRDGI